MKNISPLLAGLAFAFAFSVSSFAEKKEPVNDKCPVCGKDAKLIFHSEVKGERIIFATGSCKDKFDKAPGKFKVAKKG